MSDNNKREKLIYAVYAALILSPLIVLGIQSFLVGKNLFFGVPTWSDELDYFREILSFRSEGFSFNGSLFAGHEAALGPFGAHSFSPILAWGFYSLFSWSEHSILICNLILLCASYAAFVLINKPRGIELFFVCLIACIYSPLYLYLYTSMMEVPIYAFTIVYFSFLYRYHTYQTKLMGVLMIVAGAFVTLLRMPYIVLLLPAILSLTGYKLNKKAIRNLIIYVIAFLLAYKIYNLFCADYPDWVTHRISEAPGVIGKIKVVYSNSLTNIKRYFSFSSTPAQVTLRYVYGFTILLFLIKSLFRVNNKKLEFKFEGRAFSMFVMLGGLFAIMVSLYDIKDYRDYRTFGIVLFFSLFYLFTEKKGDMVYKYIGVFFVLVLFLTSFSDGLTKDRVIVRKAITYDAFEKNFSDEDLKGKAIGATWDINWGDAGLLKSIPAELGYKVFIEGEEIPYLDSVDYVLSTYKYMGNHTELSEKLEFMFDVDRKYLVYKVK